MLLKLTCTSTQTLVMNSSDGMLSKKYRVDRDSKDNELSPFM